MARETVPPPGFGKESVKPAGHPRPLDGIPVLRALSAAGQGFYYWDSEPLMTRTTPKGATPAPDRPIPGRPQSDPLSVDEAQRIIMESLPGCDTQTVPLERAPGRVLREELRADRDQPPFNRVAMDGIGISGEAFASGRREFRILGTQAAGRPMRRLEHREGCFEVMTGAVLPEGCDCVIPFEELEIAESHARVREGLAVQSWWNVHREASDNRRGDLLLSPGRRLDSPQISLAASLGASELLVSRIPRAAVFSTGDELVEVEARPLPHQIRRSNVHAVAAALRRAGIETVRCHHLADDPEEIRSVLDRVLDEAEVLVLSGGISMGRFDHVPEILEELGFRLLFSRVAHRPGKPFCYGVRPAEGDRGERRVFALPGNPVSSLVCCHRYVLPALEAMQGGVSRESFAVLDEPFRFPKPLTYFLPVALAPGEEGEIRARPVPTAGSGDFGALVRSDGFVELQPEPEDFPRGSVVPLYLWS